MEVKAFIIMNYVEPSETYEYVKSLLVESALQPQEASK